MKLTRMALTQVLLVTSIGSASCGNDEGMEDPRAGRRENIHGEGTPDTECAESTTRPDGVFQYDESQILDDVAESRTAVCDSEFTGECAFTVVVGPSEEQARYFFASEDLSEPTADDHERCARVQAPSTVRVTACEDKLSREFALTVLGTELNAKMDEDKLDALPRGVPLAGAEVEIDGEEVEYWFAFPRDGSLWMSAGVDNTYSFIECM